MFLISNKLEQLEFKLEKKILGFRNVQEKLEKKGIFAFGNFVGTYNKFIIFVFEEE